MFIGNIVHTVNIQYSDIKPILAVTSKNLLRSVTDLKYYQLVDQFLSIEISTCTCLVFIESIFVQTRSCLLHIYLYL